ncbi:MAG TPA: adenylate/guanylate cyclase domain-containing protein [Puia sp.]|jgi:TolB-like protein|nr:adenylate/guanylate cyclase domain-containing protein [Puia sp.]
MPHQNRQLAAILFTDIVGYTAMMQQNEVHAVSIVKHYISVLQKTVSDNGGKILNDYGDGSLCSFPSAMHALQCAVQIQQQLQNDPAVPLRIGLHVGEIFFEGEKVLGDGVNVASRIQSLGQANTILFSKEIFDKIKNQPEFKSVSLGKFEFKNVDDPVEVFALANEGLIIPKKESLAGKLKETKKSGKKKLAFVIGSIIALVVIFFSYQKFISKPEFTGDEKSIAVLPFENSGRTDSDEYISDGITQDIINNLSKISSLQKVIAWFSVKGFKKTTKSAKEIADELGVAAILTGTIQKIEGKIHIIAELIEVSTNKILWTEDYNYESKDILSIQSGVALKIVNALNANLTATERKNITKLYTENVEAYKYYKKGRWFWEKRTTEAQDSAEVYYNKAKDLDPDYALAYSGLADIYSINTKGLSPMEAIPLAKQYVAKALQLDSNLSEALATSGLINCIFDYNWDKAKSLFEKAIAANPNYSFAHLFYGNLLQWVYGKTEEGISEVKKGLSLDPLSSTLNYGLGRSYFLAKNYDSAYVYLKKNYIMDPHFAPTIPFYVLVLIQRKDFTEALNVVNTDPQGGMNLMLDIRGPCLANLYAAQGNMVLAKAELEKSLKEVPNQSPYHFARGFIAIGDFDKAVSLLERAYEVRDIRIWHIKVDPTLDPIRNDPRFKALLKKANLE